MFLNTRMKKPIIADRDIDCFIYIRKYNHVEEEKKHGLNWLLHRVIHKCDPTGIVYTKYYEPFRNIETKPGTTLASKSTRVYSGEYNGTNHILCHSPNTMRPKVATGNRHTTITSHSEVCRAHCR